MGVLHAHSDRPVSLILGLILIGEWSPEPIPEMASLSARLQVACVLLLVTPSGLWMAYYAAAGPIAAVGLAVLAITTAICVSLGARSAVTRRFADHRRWMWRCYLLLCSAVVLRLIGGLATVTGVAAPWVDPGDLDELARPTHGFRVTRVDRAKIWSLRERSATSRERLKSSGIRRFIEIKAVASLAVTIAADRHMA